ncbi:serine/threonine-protein kinase [Streptomyces sp. NPDC088789]|uniref:serine/threonine-protein kinase n=1 Tax=Streptomyces sp. NPDC088789 TaxID=3365899 RepID=UPI003808CD42
MQGLLLGDRYRLTEAIGSGGMGRVWRAHDEVLHRAVAIKELTAAHYVSDGDRAVLLARTRAEARAAARINHSAVVTVHDVLEHDGRPWIVMELVEGRSLADAVKEEGRIPPADAARTGLWVLRALRAAHTAGVLHRDVKPGNVLLARDGRVLLTDFGIAQIEGDSTITRTGEVVGSVDYLAPERVRGQDPGPSADLWALGATLYTAVEGLSPFRRTSPLGTMQAVVEEEPGEPQYAGPLGPVISALLRKDPATRPSSEEAEQLLAEAAEGRRPRAAQAYVPTTLDAGDGTGTTARNAPAAHAAPAVRAAAQAAPAAQSHGPEAPTPYRQGAGQTASRPSPGPGTGTGTSTGAGGRTDGPRPPRRQRRLRTLALVIAVAALVGGGTAVMMDQGDDSTGPPQGQQADDTARNRPNSTTPGPEASAGEGTPGGIPDGWVPVSDPLGFGLSLPADWERQEPVVDGDLQRVDYTPDGGRTFVRVAVDKSPDFADPYEHLVDLDQQLGDRLVDYRQMSLERETYRDRPAGRWEYTWTAQAKDTEFPGAYRAVDLMYVARDGVEYAIYMASPAEEWATTAESFGAVLRGWRQPVTP